MQYKSAPLLLQQQLVDDVAAGSKLRPADYAAAHSPQPDHQRSREIRDAAEHCLLGWLLLLRQQGTMRGRCRQVHRCASAFVIHAVGSTTWCLHHRINASLPVILGVKSLFEDHPYRERAVERWQWSTVIPYASCLCNTAKTPKLTMLLARYMSVAITNRLLVTESFIDQQIFIWKETRHPCIIKTWPPSEVTIYAEK
jgi:hypothetical protein